ncbi:MAG: SelB C-terminal domain-containing protein [Spirochaetales bacterium]|nr:SelB C-terminal domain-containing protein [Spirochaetales bacterium]
MNKSTDRKWHRKTGGKLPKNQFDHSVTAGGYVFEEEYFNSCISVIMEMGGAKEGTSLSDLTEKLEVSKAAVQGMVKALVNRGQGAFVKGAFHAGDGWGEKTISAFDRNILERLRASGIEGLDPLVMKIPGADYALTRLERFDLAVKLGDNLYWEKSIPDILCGKITSAFPTGSRINVQSVRELTGLSRRYIIPLFGIMEDKKMVVRDGDERVVL